MDVLKCYTFRLKTNNGQSEIFRRWAGMTRFVWNTALALQKRAASEEQSPIFYVEMSSFLTNWKKDPFPWPYDAPADILHPTLRDLDCSWKKCVKEGAGAPRFKKRGLCRCSFRFPHLFSFDGNRVKLPKVGWLKFFKSRKLAGEPRNITVFERAGCWYMAVCCKTEIPEPVHPSASVVGIDLGIARFATLSDGHFIEPINPMRLAEKALARAQRKLSRKVRGSNRRKKAALRVAMIQRNISNARKDFLHKTSTNLCKTHAVIAM